MKIKIEMTLNVDAEELEAYRDELGYHGETLREFIRDYVISGGIGCLEESLMNTGFDPNAVEVIA